jgi:hypothetical protein
VILTAPREETANAATKVPRVILFAMEPNTATKTEIDLSQGNPNSFPKR